MGKAHDKKKHVANILWNIGKDTTENEVNNNRKTLGILHPCASKKK
jgi:hypothetical protein